MEPKPDDKCKHTRDSQLYYFFFQSNIYPNIADLKKLDIMVSHDWPSGITDYGDVEALLRIKPHFADDIKKAALGNPATMNLLHVKFLKRCSL